MIVQLKCFGVGNLTWISCGVQMVTQKQSVQHPQILNEMLNCKLKAVAQSDCETELHVGHESTSSAIHLFVIWNWYSAAFYAYIEIKVA